MGRAIDLFVTYRFIRLLRHRLKRVMTYKLGIIDKDGNRTDMKLATANEKNAYGSSQTSIQYQETVW